MSFFPHYGLLALSGVLLVAAIVLVVRNRRTRARTATLRRLVLALLLVLIAARPLVGSSLSVTYEAGVDVVILMDRTTSMAAEDYAGNQPRLDGAKHDLARVVSSVAGSRFAVVVFDNGARTALPYTTDASAVGSLIDAIGWRETTYGTGSDISVAVPLARELLERSRRERPDVGRYLVYVGDGEQTATTTPSSFAELAPLIDGGLVLGYGTAAGGPMKRYEGSDDYVTLDGAVVRPKVGIANLRRISTELGVPFQHRTSDTALRLEVKGEVLVPTERRDPRGFELYWILAGLGVVVLAIDLWDGIGRLRRARESVR